MNKCQLVRTTCQYVKQRAKHVKINENNIAKVASLYKYTKFNQFKHHKTPENIQTTLLYLFALDCLNFCFWPLENFQYQHLAQKIQIAINQGLTLKQIVQIQPNKLCTLIFSNIKIPLVQQRSRILKEMAQVVLNIFQGSFCKIIMNASSSAVKLLNILTSNFANFQDHSIYQGHQIHFYKRAQILIGDIWAKFEGKNIGYFHDIAQLTMFADYRVPQILYHYGILEYSLELQNLINSKNEIRSGSQMELQIRSCTIIAVELLKQYLLKNGYKCITIQVDWFLWQNGQNNLNNLLQHHRTLTIYY